MYHDMLFGCPFFAITVPHPICMMPYTTSWNIRQACKLFGDTIVHTVTVWCWEVDYHTPLVGSILFGNHPARAAIDTQSMLILDLNNPLGWQLSDKYLPTMSGCSQAGDSHMFIPLGCSWTSSGLNLILKPFSIPRRIYNPQILDLDVRIEHLATLTAPGG